MKYKTLTGLGRLVFNELIYNAKVYYMSDRITDLDQQNIVLCSNHTTNGDGYILHSLLSKYCHIKTLMMAEFWDSYPSLAGILDSIDVCPIHRNDKMKAFHELKGCINYLKDSSYDRKGLLIFPDGEHVDPKVYHTKDYKESVELGAFLMAVRSGAPVLPIFIEPNSFFKDCIIVIGELIESYGKSTEELRDKYIEQLNILYEYAKGVAKDIYNRPINNYRIEKHYHCKDTSYVDIDPNIERVKNYR